MWLSFSKVSYRKSHVKLNNVIYCIKLIQNVNPQQVYKHLLVRYIMPVALPTVNVVPCVFVGRTNVRLPSAESSSRSEQSKGFPIGCGKLSTATGKIHKPSNVS